MTYRSPEFTYSTCPGTETTQVMPIQSQIPEQETPLFAALRAELGMEWPPLKYYTQLVVPLQQRRHIADSSIPQAEVSYPPDIDSLLERLREGLNRLPDNPQSARTPSDATSLQGPSQEVSSNDSPTTLQILAELRNPHQEDSVAPHNRGPMYPTHRQKPQSDMTDGDAADALHRANEFMSAASTSQPLGSATKPVAEAEQPISRVERRQLERAGRRRKAALWIGGLLGAPAVGTAIGFGFHYFIGK